MNHKQFESWILDEPELNKDQRKELADHLTACTHCKQLNEGWQNSKHLMMASPMRLPAAGFTDRWQLTCIKKRQQEKVRHYRITVLAFIMSAFLGSLIYIIASGTFIQMVANVFTRIFQLGVDLSNGLSEIRILFSTLPVYVPLTIGFLMFGMFNAFFMTTLFTIWNIKNRKMTTNEIPLD